MITNYVSTIVREVSGWEGIQAEPHRFGGTEFKLGKVEVGHIHRNGMVDIPYTRAIRDQLLAEGKAGLHHLLVDSGWMTFYVRTEADVQRAIWLYRVSYLQKTGRRAPELAEKVAAQVEMSDALRRLVLG